MTDPVERFRSHYIVDDASGCWLWSGYIRPNGYVSFWPGGKKGSRNKVYAHRWSYEHHVGPIPDGLHIDHLCGTKHCVNPAHLEVVTQQENNRRRPPNQHRDKTHCIRGHEYTPENTAPMHGKWRRCRECSRMRSQAWKAKQRRKH